MILSRAARSARRAAALRPRGSPREPQTRRVLVPQAPPPRAAPWRRAARFSAATPSTRSRGSRSSRACATRACTAHVVHADSRNAEYATTLRRRPDLAAVSGADRLPRAAPLRLRAARARRPPRARARCRRRRTPPRAALGPFRAGIAAALANAAASLAAARRFSIVVNDRRDLYPEILDRAGLRLEARLRRHVNRRTGRRAGEYYEDVLVARPA